MPTITPVLFISSTKHDLEAFRTAAKDAAIQANFHPEMMEHFAAQGALPPYTACMDMVDKCDVLLVIVAHRYGWVPSDQPGNLGKSITWLECEHALSSTPKKEVLALVVDEKSAWPLELRESYRLMQASEEGKLTPELAAEVTANVNNLHGFKNWLGSLGFTSTFITPGDLKTSVITALHDWRVRHPEFGSWHKASRRDPEKYLSTLRNQTAWIDIRGLQVGTGKAYRFPIDELYIPLTTISVDGLRDAVPLEEALRHPRLVIVGDPGSGKTTFLRRVAYHYCSPVSSALNVKPKFPIFLSIGLLHEYISRSQQLPVDRKPSTRDSPAWLIHLLTERSKDFNWDLDQEFFEQKLDDESTIVLMDGLDEVPDRAAREATVRLLENMTGAYKRCQFVVTTRPATYEGRGTLDGFRQVTVDSLSQESVRVFLTHWSSSMYPDDRSSAEGHRDALLGALETHNEIARMASNPVMLTALAVVHWNEHRMPEQRADLYDSVLRWLSRAREQREGRAPAEECLKLLGQVALAMQSQQRGRLTQVSRTWAAEVIAPQLLQISEPERLRQAELFLEQEEVDSGIVVSRGPDLRFWHLTFQEYLAARSIAGLPDREQQELLIGDTDRLYRPEWREVVLLLAGTLLVRQGAAKVDALLRAILENLGRQPKLAALARGVGLIGSVLADLQTRRYEFRDPEYRIALDRVLDIFRPEANGLEFKVRLDAAEALGQAGDPRFGNNRNWVTLPAGTFLMGAQKENSKKANYDAWAQWDELPVHSVHLDAFQIGKYPVTVGEFKKFIEYGGYQNETLWKAGGFGRRVLPNGWVSQEQHSNRPVVGINHFEAAAYCASIGARLPTEAEWERSARGIGGRHYPWGVVPPDPGLANFNVLMLAHPTPVGLFAAGATPEGVMDQSGNVYEWVSDWYAPDYYAKTARANPQGPSEGEYRVTRGGSWAESGVKLRGSHRSYWGPSNIGSFLGFRCAKSAP